ncbi:cell division GTPase [Paenibacillus sp. FSL K6-2859]|uniref:cell division GTPase n=1 Tax=Paenibacillus sp. FSL K6-2859 TaxID=2921482 RepID=UPI0030FBF72F
MENLITRISLSLDGKWPLEQFVTTKNAVAGIKYGFIGLGQGGSKIVDAFAAIKHPVTQKSIYPCMIVNSNLGDMGQLKNIPQSMQLSLEGYERGVGKDPEIGKQAFIENGARIFEVIAKVMKDCDMIYVGGSMGGGTATGSINVLVDAISDGLRIKTGAIISLPRPDAVESLNAYNATSELVSKLTDFREDLSGEIYRGLENIVILDNEKIFTDHMNDPEAPKLTWDFYSNYKVASIMHEWNVLTSMEGDITLDATDLMNQILCKGGILTFAKKKINMLEINTREDLINEIVDTYKGRNVLANDFSYSKDLQSLGLVIVIPKDRKDLLNQDALGIIRNRFNEEIPDVSVYTGLVTSSTTRQILVYTIANMSGLPARAKNLRVEAEELLRKKVEREQQASGFTMGEPLLQGTSAVSARKITGANPFDKKDTKVAKKSVAYNPFKDSTK